MGTDSSCPRCGAHAGPRRDLQISVSASEHAFSRRLANKILDRPYGDPDDDLAVLARQLLRADEEIGNLSARLGERLMTLDADGSVRQILCENCATARAAALAEAAMIAEQMAANASSPDERSRVRNDLDIAKAIRARA